MILPQCRPSFPSAARGASIDAGVGVLSRLCGRAAPRAHVSDPGMGVSLLPLVGHHPPPRRLTSWSPRSEAPSEVHRQRSVPIPPACLQAIHRSRLTQLIDSAQAILHLHNRTTTIAFRLDDISFSASGDLLVIHPTSPCR